MRVLVRVIAWAMVLSFLTAYGYSRCGSIWLSLLGTLTIVILGWAIYVIYFEL